MITVLLNGESKAIEPSSLLSDAIQKWQLGDTSFAVAVNKNFVPKTAYADTQLAEGDQIELLMPMQGG